MTRTSAHAAATSLSVVVAAATGLTINAFSASPGWSWGAALLTLVSLAVLLNVIAIRLASGEKGDPTRVSVSATGMGAVAAGTVHGDITTNNNLDKASETDLPK